jgi:hypothetical protein
MMQRWPWVVLALLGAYHGLNPGMGWLFALALGLQEKRRSAVLYSLLPIAAGHAAAIALTLFAFRAVQEFVSLQILKWIVASILFILGIYRLFRASHPRGAGMRVGGKDLAVWSFLMASAHGAGLMLIPVLLAQPMVGMGMGGVAVNEIKMNGMKHTIAAAMRMPPHPLSWTTLALATFVHTASMLAVAGTLAILCFETYERIGLKLLRHTWINFDLLWATALLIAGVVALRF